MSQDDNEGAILSRLIPRLDMSEPVQTFVSRTFGITPEEDREVNALDAKSTLIEHAITIQRYVRGHLARDILTKKIWQQIEDAFQAQSLKDFQAAEEGFRLLTASKEERLKDDRLLLRRQWRFDFGRNMLSPLKQLQKHFRRRYLCKRLLNGSKRLIDLSISRLKKSQISWECALQFCALAHKDEAHLLFQLEKAFKEQDQFGTGVVGREAALPTLYRVLYQHEHLQPGVEGLFNCFKNKDSNFDYVVFCNFLESRQLLLAEQGADMSNTFRDLNQVFKLTHTVDLSSLCEMFSLNDLDGNNTISKYDCFESFEKLNLKIPNKKMETLLSKYDFNDDGTIFYKSLVKDMKNWFVFYSHKTTVERQASIIAFWLEQVLIHRREDQPFHFRRRTPKNVRSDHQHSDHKSHKEISGLHASVANIVHTHNRDISGGIWHSTTNKWETYGLKQVKAPSAQAYYSDSLILNTNDTGIEEATNHNDQVLVDEIQGQRQDIERLALDKDRLQREQAELESKRAAFAHDNQVLVDEMRGQRQDIERLALDKDRLQREQAELESKRAAFAHDNQVLVDEMRGQRQDIERLALDKDRLQREQAELESKRAAFAHDNQVLVDEMRGQRQDIDQHHPDIIRLRKNLMDTIVSNNIFKTEELEFLFQSTLEFTALNRETVHAMLSQLRVDLYCLKLP